MWLQRPSLHRGFLPLCAALVAFRFRHHLLRLCQALVPWKGWGSGLDTPCQEQLLCRFVLYNSVHGQPESVLQTFDQWIQEPAQGLERSRVCRNLLGPEKGVFLDSVVTRVAPAMALELGTYCGYSAVRMLRQLPSGGKLYTVEQRCSLAEMAEEMILVAGFKNVQFQILVLPSGEAIPSMRTHDGVETFDLVLMDHSPEQYLTDIRALEQSGLLSPDATILANNTGSPGAEDFLHHVQRSQGYRIRSSCQGLLEIEKRLALMTSTA